MDFITSINHKNTPIDQLPSEKLIQFGSWFRDLPRRDGRTKKRSVEQINNAISELKLAYYKVAVRNRYISNDLVPQIIRLNNRRTLLLNATYWNSINTISSGGSWNTNTSERKVWMILKNIAGSYSPSLLV